MRLGLAAIVVAALAAGASAAPAAGPAVPFTVHAHTGLPLGDVLWTGREFLYVTENTGAILAADARGGAPRPWATFEPGGEETRCAPSPARYWPAGIYCHTPDNRILRFAADGTGPTTVAQLPGTQKSDGALAFDTVGSFGYALLAATGGSSFAGGAVYAVRRDGRVRTVGTYSGPGGAEGIVVAPRSFGAAGGSALLAIDEDRTSGRLLAVDPRGTVRVVAEGLANGANPIAVIAKPPARRPAGAPPAGLYAGETFSTDVFFAPASALAAYRNDVVVGAEATGAFWIVRPRGRSFETVPLATGLPARDYNFEGAVYVP